MRFKNGIDENNRLTKTMVMVVTEKIEYMYE